MRSSAGSIVAFTLFAISNVSLFAQGPVQDYRDATQVFRAHTRGDFFQDDSHAAVDALDRMWAASALAVIRVLSMKPEATANEIDAALCELPSSVGDCGEKEGAQSAVVALGPHLFLASQFSGEAGTVFIVGLRSGKPTLLWSINSADRQKIDSRNLLSAWRADRAGEGCRTEHLGYAPGTCGPLYAGIGILSSDAAGRTRFYVDAGYAQIMGATVGKQTSVWLWDGDSAHLLWIDQHDFMIDQKIGTAYSDGVLTIGEKDEFRSFNGCGSCEARQMVRRLKITSTGIEDLGKTSTTPELDLIDELFWRLANNRPTTDIAAPEVSHLLRPQVLAAKEDSKKIAPDWFSVGMLDDISIKHDGDVERVCFTADEIGRLYFTVENQLGKQPKLIEVKQPSGDFGECPK